MMSDVMCVQLHLATLRHNIILIVIRQLLNSAGKCNMFY